MGRSWRQQIDRDSVFEDQEEKMKEFNLFKVDRLNKFLFFHNFQSNKNCRTSYNDGLVIQELLMIKRRLLYVSPEAIVRGLRCPRTQGYAKNRIFLSQFSFKVNLAIFALENCPFYFTFDTQKWDPGRCSEKHGGKMVGSSLSEN